VFKVEFFVDDKNLASSLRALVGKSLGHPKVEPVVNAVVEKKGGQTNVKAKNTGSIVETMRDWLSGLDADVVYPSDVKKFCKNRGLADSSYSSYLRIAVENKFLKYQGSGKDSTYDVNRKALRS